MIKKTIKRILYRIPGLKNLLIMWRKGKNYKFDYSLAEKERQDIFKEIYKNHTWGWGGGCVTSFLADRVPTKKNWYQNIVIL